MRLGNGSGGIGLASALVFVSVLACVAQPSDALPQAAEAEARAIREVATTVTQVRERATTLKTQIDEVLRNLERQGAQARGGVPGWERLLNDLRSEAARLRAMRDQLGTGNLEAARGESPSPAERLEIDRALRTFRELELRVPRLEEAIAAAARSLQDLQNRMGVSEPRAGEAPPSRPPAEKQVTEEQVKDLSGVWVASGELRYPWDKEWRIRHAPKSGAITISGSRTHVPGRSMEFTGVIKGGMVTATYRVTDPSVINPEFPERVRREHAKNRPTFTLRLKVTKDGTLDGVEEFHRVGWDKKTLKITRVTAATVKIVLVKKASLPAVAEPKPPTVKDNDPGVKGPPEPEEATLQELERRAANLKEIAARARRALEETTRRRDAARRQLEEARAGSRNLRNLESLHQRYEREAREMRQQLEDQRGMGLDLQRRIDELGRTHPSAQPLLRELRDVQGRIDFLNREATRYESYVSEYRERIAQAERGAESAHNDVQRLERVAEQDRERHEQAQADADRARRTAEEARQAAGRARRARP